MSIAISILIPFIGTTLGAACALLMKGAVKPIVQKILLGFASGVMVVVSVWSFLIPAVEMPEDMGKLAFIPAAVGLLAGIGFLLLMDKIVPHLRLDHEEPEGIGSSLSEITMPVLMVTPRSTLEGMAVGVVLAGMLTGGGSIVATGTLALAIDIAIQNLPEGAIISVPLRSERKSRSRAFLLGTLPEAVGSIGTVMTTLLASYIVSVLSHLLSLAAGAILYVVVEELMPGASEGEHTNIGTLGFAVGFVIMMVLDVALR